MIGISFLESNACLNSFISGTVLEEMPLPLVLLNINQIFGCSLYFISMTAHEENARIH